MKSALMAAALLICAAASRAHDAWVQTNTNVIRFGDTIHVDLMLGNHGNEHRDFKLASKADLGASTLEVVAPGGKIFDLKDRMVDMGYTPQEGFWSTRFDAADAGLYTVASTFEKVMSYAPVRDIKSAKTFFVVSKSLDKVPENNPGFDRVLGHPLELVARSNPVTPMGPGQALTVELLYKGKPLPNVKVSFIPRGANLAGEMDARYERMTDSHGRATYSPNEATYYLVAAHWKEPKERGKDYEYTNYSATLTLFVPKICPCCGG